MKRQYASPATEVMTIKAQASLMENSITKVTGTDHDLEISEEPVDHADSRSHVWDD